MNHKDDPRFQELLDFKTSKPEFNGLGVGTHVCRIGRWEVLTSFEADFKGTPKAKLPEWKDPTAQVAITFVQVEGDGAITHRFNTKGYVRVDDFVDKPEALAKIKKAYGEIRESNGYLLVQKDGQWIRAKDEKRTEQALGILNQLMIVLGCGEGVGVEALDEVMNDKCIVQIEVISTEFEGRQILKVSPRFKSVPIEVVDKLNGIGADKDFD
jgi:hypothetical protein